MHQDQGRRGRRIGGALVVVLLAVLVLASAGHAMYPGGSEHLPDPARKAVYDRDYRRFLALYRHRAELESID